MSNKLNNFLIVLSMKEMFYNEYILIFFITPNGLYLSNIVTYLYTGGMLHKWRTTKRFVIQHRVKKTTHILIYFPQILYWL